MPTRSTYARASGNAWGWNCAAWLACPLELLTPGRKSIVASCSFGQALRTQDEVAEAVSVFASRAAVKLRRQGPATSHLSVFLQTNPFRKQNAQYMPKRGVALPVGTADTAKLIAATQAAFGAICRDGYR